MRKVRTANTLAIVLGGMCALAIVVIHRSDVLARRKPVTYSLDELANGRFKILEQGCEKLAQASRICRVETQLRTGNEMRARMLSYRAESVALAGYNLLIS